MAPTTARGIPLHLSADHAGKRFVYGSQEAVVVRDAGLVDFRVFESHAKRVTTAQCAPTGDRVFSADETGHGYIFHMNNPQLVSPWDFQASTLPIHDATMTAEGDKLAFVGDLAGSKAGKTASLNLKKTDQDLVGHSMRALTCSFKPTRPFKLYTAGEDQSINVYGLPGWELNKTLALHSGFVNSLRVNREGTILASCSGDKSIVLTSTATDEQVVKVAEAHEGSLYGVSWSLDDQRFATCSADKRVKVWSNEGKLLAQLSVSENPGVPDMQMGVAWVHNGLLSVSLSGAINFWTEESISANGPPTLVVYGHNV